MSNITFTLSLPTWLAQWYSFRCGGEKIIRLRKGSLESAAVQRFSRRKKDADEPDIPHEGDLVIEIPENKVKPAAVYCFIPPSTKNLLYKIILECFDLSLFEDLVRPFPGGSLKKELIETWMEENEIEPTETNYFGVEQRYNRLKKRMLNNERVKKARKKHRK